MWPPGDEHDLSCHERQIDHEVQKIARNSFSFSFLTSSTGNTLVSVSNFRAVCFDWRGTLVVDMTTEEWVARALTSIGRGANGADLDDIVDKIVSRSDVDRLWADGIDSDAIVHRETYISYLDDAGVDSELIQALYREESNAANNPFADDVLQTFSQISKLGVQIVILSDIHFDIRPAFRDGGLANFVDSYVLSFEQGVQKPDRRIFEKVLASLCIKPGELLMVGDRAAYDGAAVEVGIPTILVPPLLSIGDCRLHLVVAILSEH